MGKGVSQHVMSCPPMLMILVFHFCVDLGGATGTRHALRHQVATVAPAKQEDKDEKGKRKRKVFFLSRLSLQAFPLL
jgi:hypothetical protein